MSTPTAAHGALPEAGEWNAFESWWQEHARSQHPEDKYELWKTWQARAALSPASPAPAAPFYAPAVSEAMALLDQLGYTYQKNERGLLAWKPAPAVPSDLFSALQRIASQTPAFQESVLGHHLWRCAHCKSTWSAGHASYHLPNCAFVIALEGLAATPAQQTQSDAVAGAVAWEYRNGSGIPFLTHDDPAKWHPHDRAGFNSFRALAYATPPQQATPANREVYADTVFADVNMERVMKALTLLGIAGPGGYEELRARLPECINDVTRGVESLMRSIAEATQQATPSAAASIKPDVQGEDDKLWCVNVLGPDDVYATRTRMEALEEANRQNIFIAGLPRHEYDPVLHAVVIEWPHTASSHAEDLKSGAPTNRAALKEAPGGGT